MLASSRETTQVTGDEPGTEGRSGGVVDSRLGGCDAGSGAGVSSVIGGGV